MYNKPQLSLAQTQAAINAMIAKATQEPDRPVAMAIVDDAGNLLTYARMDNCRPNPQTFAIRKAYTSALSGVDSAVYADRAEEPGPQRQRHGQPQPGIGPRRSGHHRPGRQRRPGRHRRQRPIRPRRRRPSPPGSRSVGFIEL